MRKYCIVALALTMLPAALRATINCRRRPKIVLQSPDGKKSTTWKS